MKFTVRKIGSFHVHCMYCMHQHLRHQFDSVLDGMELILYMHMKYVWCICCAFL